MDGLLDGIPRLLTTVAADILEGIEEDTVEFRPNYDGREQEPVVLPAAFPNLLANGSAGIAVASKSSATVASVRQWVAEHLSEEDKASSGKPKALSMVAAALIVLGLAA